MNWKDVLHYGGGALLLIAGALAPLVNNIPGVHIDSATVIVAGLTALGIGAKADQALKVLIAFLAGGWILMTAPANAANLNPPISPYLKAPPAVSCTITSCTGFFVGGNLMNTGTSLNVIGTGLNGIAQNGLGMGGQLGYEFFANSFYAAAYGIVDYDVSLQTPASVTDRFTYGGGIRLGYSLAGIFGANTGGQTPTLPQQLLSSLMTPYILAEEVNRHGQAAIGAGAGVEALIAADPTGHSSWTLNADLINYTYNQGGSSGTIAGLPTAQGTETVVRASLSKHFGW